MAVSHPAQCPSKARSNCHGHQSDQQNAMPSTVHGRSHSRLWIASLHSQHTKVSQSVMAHSSELRRLHVRPVNRSSACVAPRSHALDTTERYTFRRLIESDHQPCARTIMTSESPTATSKTNAMYCTGQHQASGRA